jgi:uncharacterized protein
MEKELLKYLYHKIIPIYRHFDAAHQIDHVETIIHSSLQIAKDYDVNYDMVYVIACYHDIGIKFGRNDHHITGGLFLYNDQELKKYFNEFERNIMKEAVEDHRASNKTAPRSIYGKIIAEADRDIDLEKIILRTCQFGLKNYQDLSENEHTERAYLHILEKYGPNGYLKLWLETDKNIQGLKIIHLALEDKINFKKMIENAYRNIKNNLLLNDIFLD